MNILRSHFNRVTNNGLIAQHRLRQIHQALLHCLENNNILSGREGYVPGKVNLLEKNSLIGRPALLRLFVSRNHIDLFFLDKNIPHQVVLATPSGSYQVLDGPTYTLEKRKQHVPYYVIPHVLGELSRQLTAEKTSSNIEFSLVS